MYSYQTVHNIRQRYSEKGLDVAIGGKKRETLPVEPKITGEVEAGIIALSCSTPPKGRSRWSLRPLADKSDSKIAGDLLSTSPQSPAGDG